MIKTRFSSDSQLLSLSDLRIAVFNFLFAKHYNGEFYLKIENSNKSPQIISSDLEWLGIFPDKKIFVKDREKIYDDYVRQLIIEGFAYPDPPNGEKKYPYRGMNRNLQPAVSLALLEDTGFAVRLKIPDGNVILDDLIKNQVPWDLNKISDPVIIHECRENQYGKPTANFSTAIDDIELDITHVIRNADEDLSNTVIQLIIMEYLEHSPPVYAHIPPIMDSMQSKFEIETAKRHIDSGAKSALNRLGFNITDIEKREEINPAVINFYQCLGFRPESVLNYIAKLGHKGKTEVCIKDSLINEFLLKDLDKKPKCFNYERLEWFNEQHLKSISIERKIEECHRFFTESGIKTSKEKLGRLITICHDHISKYSDVLRILKIVDDKIFYDPANIAVYISPNQELLKELKDKLIESEYWTTQTIQSMLQTFLNERDLFSKKDVLIVCLKICIFGNIIPLPIFDFMGFIGKKVCLERINDALNL